MTASMADVDSPSHRATRACIDLDAIAHNVHTVRRYADATPLMAVVKADGYGHGAIAVARAALAAGAAWLGVAVVDEGVRLRRTGVEAPILVLAPAVADEFGDALTHGLTLAIGSLDDGRLLSRVAASLCATARVHAEVDTGMHRFGFGVSEVDDLEALAGLPNLVVDGIYTHFVASESPDTTLAHQQVMRFLSVADELERRGVRIPIRHASNSGTLGVPEARLSLVRPGIALYGYDPSGATGTGLRPALTLVSRLVRVHDVPPGTGVSYNHTATTTRPTRLGLVPIGYADGLPRSLSNTGAMLVGGHRCPIVGRVCMDQTVIDVTDVPGARPGDEVVVIGRQGSAVITADDIAALTDTISYEVLTGIGARVPRDYTGQITDPR